jgi:hypothetical protein
MTRGGPKGNTKNFQSGAYSLLAIRTKGKPDGNTKLGRAFRSQELEYMRDMGGEENLSLAQRQIANDNVWCDFLIAAMDFELSTKKRLTRKGKPHPLIDLRIRVAGHRRANYQLIGLKRVQKTVDWRSVVQEDGTAGAAADLQQASETPADSLPTNTGDTGETSDPNG